MLAWKRGRTTQAMVLALAAFGAFETSSAWAQGLLRGRQSSAKSAAPATNTQTQPAANAQGDQPKFVQTRIPANPTDAIAIVNGEAITRQQLADECVARRGQEILDTLIARRMIDQALRKKHLEVTAAEIDAEIDNVAANVAHVGREAWLRTLDKERGISPVQYARDIIYPALALRKLATGRFTVTQEDMRNSFEAQYGDKIRVRIIMVDKLLKAQAIWEELRKNPGGFEKMAQEQSQDVGSRSLGGLLAEPISRHAHPRNVSQAAFDQLVDGDPKDKDPSHKPRDGSISGPIQVAEATWVLIKREGLVPAQNVDPKNDAIKKNVYTMIYEVKLKEAMSEVFEELMRQAAVDNKLTGHVKFANEESHPDHQVDGKVKLMSNPDGEIESQSKSNAAAAGSSIGAKLPAPAAASSEVVKQVESLRQGPSK